MWLQHPGARTVAAFVLLLASGSRLAFSEDASNLKFEVASVRPAVRNSDAPSFMHGGPGTPDPEWITYQRQSLMRLLHAAYDLDFDQLSGPGWLGEELYNVVAKVPPGTTKEQLELMWQDLLAERFHLKAHFTQKEFPVYELSVAKGGPKFRKLGETPVRQEAGFPVPRPGEKWALSIVPPRNVRQTFRDYSIAEFLKQLGWPLSSLVGSNALVLGRVVDKTNLDSHYDFTLEFAGSRSPGGAFPSPLPEGQIDTAPTLIEALREQLGLRLEESKALLRVLVVEHVDRVPTQN